jgi:hypothetical protein
MAMERAAHGLRQNGLLDQPCGFELLLDGAQQLLAAIDAKIPEFASPPGIPSDPCHCFLHSLIVFGAHPAYVPKSDLETKYRCDWT